MPNLKNIFVGGKGAGRSLDEFIKPDSYLRKLAEKLGDKPFGVNVDLGDPLENFQNIHMASTGLSAPEYDWGVYNAARKRTQGEIGSNLEDMTLDGSIIPCGRPYDFDLCDDASDAIRENTSHDAWMFPNSFSGSKSFAERSYDTHNKESALWDYRNFIEAYNRVKNIRGPLAKQAAEETGRTVDQLKNAWLGHDVQNRKKELESELLRRYNYVAMDPFTYTDSDNRFERSIARQMMLSSDVDLEKAVKDAFKYKSISDLSKIYPPSLINSDEKGAPAKARWGTKDLRRILYGEEN